MLGWLIEKILFAAGFLSGGMLPGFLAQYRQRVGGRLDQVREDLGRFQETADRHFNGDMNALIQHHLKSTDAAFHSEGEALRAMSNDFQALNEAYIALNTDLLGQVGYFIPNADPEIARATWQDYVPAFAFTLEGLVLALVCGVVLSGIFSLLVYAVRRGSRRRELRTA